MHLQPSSRGPAYRLDPSRAGILDLQDQELDLIFRYVKEVPSREDKLNLTLASNALLPYTQPIYNDTIKQETEPTTDALVHALIHINAPFERPSRPVRPPLYRSPRADFVRPVDSGFIFEDHKDVASLWSSFSSLDAAFPPEHNKITEVPPADDTPAFEVNLIEHQPQTAVGSPKVMVLRSGKRKVFVPPGKAGKGKAASKRVFGRILSSNDISAVLKGDTA